MRSPCSARCTALYGKADWLVQIFADQAVIAIENVRLFEEVQARTRELSESLEQQTATSEVLQVISSSPGELEPVFQSMLANATRICEANFGVLFLYEEGAFRAVALHGAAPAIFVELDGATRSCSPSQEPRWGGSSRQSKRYRSPTYAMSRPIPAVGCTQRGSKQARFGPCYPFPC